MRKADLPLGGRCLPTCRLLHHADKSESRRRDECGDGPQACPGGEVRWCSEMVNKRLRRADLHGRKVGALREGCRRDLTGKDQASALRRPMKTCHGVRPGCSTTTFSGGRRRTPSEFFTSKAKRHGRCCKWLVNILLLLLFARTETARHASDRDE
jgi:hypothetical protein